MTIEKYYFESNCSGCDNLNNILEELKIKTLDFEMSDRLKAGPHIKNRNLINLPTIIFFEGEKEIGRLSGEGITKEDILKLIK